MKRTKKVVEREVRAFARARDSQFDRVRNAAGSRIQVGWDIDALLENPAGYLRAKFARDGVAVVREYSDRARGLGGKHAEAMVNAQDRGADV